jgi:hypothetical protein
MSDMWDAKEEGKCKTCLDMGSGLSDSAFHWVRWIQPCGVLFVSNVLSVERETWRKRSDSSKTH